MAGIYYPSESVTDPLHEVVTQAFAKMDAVDHRNPEHDGSACPICMDNDYHLISTDGGPEPQEEDEA